MWGRQSCLQAAFQGGPNGDVLFTPAQAGAQPRGRRCPPPDLGQHHIVFRKRIRKRADAGGIGFVGVMALIGLVGADEPSKPTVGFRLQDHRGAWHTLGEARDRKFVVLAFLGAELDPVRNGSDAKEKVITKDGSRIATWVVPTNEELMIAQKTKTIVEAQVNAG